ncbi:MAG TPA: CoA pyrophosphatase [Edaphocola sp.]|nr:CoA pyrophosphatase [Edaphocola sp.]
MIKFSEWLAARFAQPLPGKAAQVKMLPLDGPKRFPIPETTRKSSVLLLLFPEVGGWSLILIKRSADGRIHSSQIAFPGGKIEPSDSSVETAALREAYEEINLPAETVEILGRLSPLYIPASGFEVLPVVAYSPVRPPGLRPSEAEVAEIIIISLPGIIARKALRTVKSSSRPDRDLRAPGYLIDEEHFLWGASAMMLSELEALWLEFLSNG